MGQFFLYTYSEIPLVSGEDACFCWAKVGKGMGDKDEGTRSLFFYRIDNVAGKALQV